MPTYDFRCDSCGEEFEALTSVGATPDCPSCGSSETSKLFSPGFQTLKWGVRGKAAKESDSRRSEREAARQDRIAEARKKRTSGGPPGG